MSLTRRRPLVGSRSPESDRRAPTKRRSVTRRVFVVVALVIVGLPLVSTTTPADAASAPHYSAFGNDTVGDCEFAAAADLVRRTWPRARITTAQVVGAWRTDEALSGLTYLEVTGFGGHRIASFTPLTTRAQVTAAANSRGGVFAYLSLPQGAHAVAVVGANHLGPTLVMWGVATQESWAYWDHVETSAYALTWAAADTVTVMFNAQGGTGTMAPETQRRAHSADLTDTLFSMPGWTFEGWDTIANGTGTFYANGAPYPFTASLTLYALWRPDAPAAPTALEPTAN